LIAFNEGLPAQSKSWKTIAFIEKVKISCLKNPQGFFEDFCKSFKKRNRQKILEDF
jgi:hypothetical protein